MPLPMPWHPCSSEKTQEVSMDTTYNVTRSKQLRLGIQELTVKLLTPPSAASLIRRIL